MIIPSFPPVMIPFLDFLGYIAFTASAWALIGLPDMFLPFHKMRFPENVPVTRTLSTKAWHRTDSAPVVPHPIPF